MAARGSQVVSTTFGNLHYVVAELGLDRSLDGSDLTGENRLVEFADHLAWSETAKITAVATGGRRRTPSASTPSTSRRTIRSRARTPLG